MADLMPVFSALQVCSAADLNTMAGALEEAVAATPTQLSPSVRNGATAPSNAKPAIRAFGFTATTNNPGGNIDITWSPLDGVSALFVQPTLDGPGTPARADVIIVPGVINLNGASLTVYNPRTNSTAVELAKVTSTAISASVLVIGWELLT